MNTHEIQALLRLLAAIATELSAISGRNHQYTETGGTRRIEEDESNAMFKGQRRSAFETEKP
jgi:hypothetical protein